jgi:sec-independent protein translocase protein TatB
MFSLGTTEILVILVVALLIIGPSKLPEVAKTLGKGMAEFRRMSSDVKKTVDLETKLSDLDGQEREKNADAAIGSGAEEENGEGGEESSSPQDSTHASDRAESDGAGQAERPDRADSEDPDKGSSRT